MGQEPQLALLIAAGAQPEPRRVHYMPESDIYPGFGPGSQLVILEPRLDGSDLVRDAESPPKGLPHRRDTVVSHPCTCPSPTESSRHLCGWRRASPQYRCRWPIVASI